MKHLTSPVSAPSTASPPRHRGRRSIFEKATYPEDFDARHCACPEHRLADRIRDARRAYTAVLVSADLFRARFLKTGSR